MGKGILKKHESIETTDNTPDSCSKHVKWDEEKLKVSEAIKLTIPKGQIDEPKTPFQHGENGCEECADEAFKLKSGEETEEGSLSDSSFRRASITSTTSITSSSGSGWESSLSDVESDNGHDETETEAAFKSMRSQHYFMKQALQRGKELIETEDEGEYEFNE